MKKYLAILIGVLFMCTSCGSTKKLSSDAVSWNPYQVNDQLRFKSDDKKEQLYYITKVERQLSKTNPYGGIFSDEIEQLVVLYNTSKNGSVENERPLFALGRMPNGDTFVNFILELNRTFFPTNPYKLSTVNNRTVQSHTVNGKTYNDVLIFDAVPNTSEIPTVEKVYWSKSKGYIQYHLSSGRIWSLVE